MVGLGLLTCKLGKGEEGLNRNPFQVYFRVDLRNVAFPPLPDSGASRALLFRGSKSSTEADGADERWDILSLHPSAFKGAEVHRRLRRPRRAIVECVQRLSDLRLS